MGVKNPKNPSASNSRVGFSTKFSVLSSSIEVTELFSDILLLYLRFFFVRRSALGPILRKYFFASSAWIQSCALVSNSSSLGIIFSSKK